jgi:hypothetical protein
MRVIAVGEKEGEAGNGGCVRCACVAQDYGKDVDFGTWPMFSNAIGEGVYLSRFVCAVRERLWFVPPNIRESEPG